MPVSIKGTGGGSVTLSAAAAATDTTLTIPNVTGTVLQSGTAVTVAQGGTGLTSTGANGNVLTSNGTAWTSAAPATPSAPAALSTASGSAPSYSARAWVNFDGTTSTIAASGNVSSVSNTSTGVFTVNFTTAMQDTNYAAVFGAKRANQSSNTSGVVSETFTTAVRTTSAISITVGDSTSGLVNTGVVSVTIFR